MHAYIPRAALLAALALGAWGAPGQAGAQVRDRDRDRDSDRYAEGSSIDTTIAFAADGTVSLTLISGDIRVTGWSRGEARIRAFSERGEIRSQLSRSRIELDVRSRRGHMGDTRYELSVPAGARVVAHTTSGDITVRAVAGEVEAHSTSGEIEVADLGGRATVESVSGSVHATGVRGDLSIEAVSGTVDVRDVAGGVEAESVSGTVRLRGIRSRAVRAETVSGEIEFQGTLDPAGRYDFDAHSGDVRLVVPADAGAQVSVETFSGTIDSDFPMTLQPADRRRERDEKRMDFTLGRGGARVRIETFSGRVVLERGTTAR
jgi:DUF4097 and DUF4098 domain-containing protein YvlB